MKMPKEQSDLVITLGKASYKCFKSRRNIQIHFNISDFLRRHLCKPKSWISELNQFTKRIDARIHMDPNSDEHVKHIWISLETFLENVLGELQKNSNITGWFKNAFLIPTGSMYSNVKVGYPHEADYLLVLENPKHGEKYKVEVLYKQIESFVRDETILGQLMDTLPLEFIGIKENSGKGVCFYFRHNQTGQGVSVDFTPVHQVRNNDPSTFGIQLTEKANRYLGCRFAKLVTKGKIYRLIEETECDTGLVENDIVLRLSQAQKRGFRVAKYIIQNCDHVVPSYINKWALRKKSLYVINTIGHEDFWSIFGVKPSVSSYVVRLCFLNLLMHIHRRREYKLVTDGLLTLCLVEMVRTIADCNQYSRVNIGVSHPLLDLDIIPVLSNKNQFSRGPLNKITTKFEVNS